MRESLEQRLRGAAAFAGAAVVPLPVLFAEPDWMLVLEFCAV